MTKEIEKYLNTMNDALEVIEEIEQEVQINSLPIGAIDSVELEQSIVCLSSPNNSARDEVKDIINYLNYSDAECLNEKMLFIRYKAASTFMSPTFGITPKEAFLLLAHFAKRNYTLSESSQDRRVVYINDLRKVKFEHTTSEEVERIFKNSEELARYYEGTNLTEEEKIIREEIRSKMSLFVTKYDDFSYHNDRFYEHFVMKFPNIDLDDIIDALNDLEFLEVKEDILALLKTYFLGIYKTNLGKNSIIYDIDLENVYLMTLVEDELAREDFSNEIIRHNKLVERKTKNSAANQSNQKIEEPKLPKKIYLTEKDVRELKKYIRNYYDLYNAKLLKTPDFENLIKCIECLEKLEEDSDSINRFLTLVVTEIRKINYIATYEDLIILISYFIKYKISRVTIDVFIKKYKKLQEKEENIIAYLVNSYEEIKMYDEKLASEIFALLSQVFIIDDENYPVLKKLAESCVAEMNKYSFKTDYEYTLGLKKLGR